MPPKLSARSHKMVGMAEEIWKPVVGYEGSYEVSDLGRVRSLDRVVVTRRGPRRYRGRLLKLTYPGAGYPAVQLLKVGVARTGLVHHLVLAAFVGPRPPGMEACHYDDDKTNGQLSNLRYASRSENTLDRVRNGIHPMQLKTHCPEGHAYAGENLIVDHGRRRCRVCKNRKSAEGKRRRRAEARAAA